MDLEKRQSIRLRRVLSERFDEEELRTLCFDLNVDYDSLRGEGKAGKARELLGQISRRERMNDLIATIGQLRPDIDWEDISTPNNKSLLVLQDKVEPKRIEIAISTGDITSFDADLIALKFAQAFFGADLAVAKELDIDLNRVQQSLSTPDSHRIFHSLGKLGAGKVLFVSVPPLYEFGYTEIREFAARTLEILMDNAPSTSHLAMTVHGVGYGLDENEALRSQLAGYLDAFDANRYPPDLSKITLVELDPFRVQRLRASLEEAVPSGCIEVSSAFSVSLTAGRESIAKPHILVAMSPTKNVEDTFYYGIKAPANKAGYLCERVNLVDIAGDEGLEYFKTRIETASFVIAELTVATPNLYLLVGYAWGKNRSTIILIKKSKSWRFDKEKHQVIVYDTIRDLEEALKKRLGA